MTSRRLSDSPAFFGQIAQEVGENETLIAVWGSNPKRPTGAVQIHDQDHYEGLTSRRDLFPGLRFYASSTGSINPNDYPVSA